MIVLTLACCAAQLTQIDALEIQDFTQQIENDANETIDSIDNYKIDVENIYQNPELPNGCEIVSGAILLKHLGYNVSKTDLADNYLVKSSGWYGADPWYEYMGNPRNQSGASCGFYVWQGPVIDACNLYIENHPEMIEDGQVDKKYQFIDISGCDFENLLKVIKSGRAVGVWVTIGYVNPSYYGYAWTSRYGNYIHVRRNLHCMVINGFDENQEIVYLTDPLGINKTISIDRFKAVWEEMGSHAFTYAKV